MGYVKEVDTKVTYKKTGGRKKTTKRRKGGKKTNRKRRNPTSAVRFGKHKSVPKPVDAPNDALHRALIAAPFHARQIMGPNYQLARLCSDGQFGPTRLIEFRQTIEVKMNTNTSANICISPSLLYHAYAYNNSGTPLLIFDGFNSGTCAFRPVQGILSQTSGVTSGRVLAMGASLISTENLTAASGQIGCVVRPGDGAGMGHSSTTAGVSMFTMQDLANMNGSFVGRAVEGVHCYWIPEDSIMASSVATVKNGSGADSALYNQVSWDYSQFLPIGWTYVGTRASSVAYPATYRGDTISSGGTAVAVSDYEDLMGTVFGSATENRPDQVTMLNLAPNLFFRIEGATGSGAACVYKLETVMHVEVIDYQRGHDLAPGALGIHPAGHRGIIGTVTHDVEAAFHEVEHVAGSAVHIAGKAVSIGEDIVKYAMMGAALF